MNSSYPTDSRDPWQAAIEYGIDIAKLERAQALTPAQRLEQHEQALARVRAARQAGIRYYGRDPRHPEAAD